MTPLFGHRRPAISRRHRVLVRRLSLVGSGSALMVLGMLSVPSPVPVGFVLFVLGLFMTAKGSRRVRRNIKLLRRRVPLFSRSLNHAKRHMPPPVRSFIERSDPET